MASFEPLFTIATDEVILEAKEATAADAVQTAADRAAVESVVATTDGLMTAVQADPESDFARAQSATIGTQTVEDMSTKSAPLRVVTDALAAKHATDSRAVAENFSQNGAPMVFIGGRVSAIAATTGVAKYMNFDREDVDSDAIRASGSTRLIARKTGLWDVGVTIEWAANATGTRMVEVLVNGAVKARVGPVAPAATGTTVQEIPRKMYSLVKDDYVEVRVTQTSGADLNIVTDLTQMSMRYSGAVVGQVNNGAVVFDSAQQYRGLSKYLDRSATVLPERVFLEPDPTGRDRTVMRVWTRPEDDEKLYPRVQLATSSSYDGTVWVGFGLWIPADLDPEYRIMLHELHGPPFGEGGPMTIRLDRDGLSMSVNNPALGDYDSQIYWRWQPPRGQWVDLAFRITLGLGTAGSMEVWRNTGSGWAQQTLSDGTGGTTLRRQYDTLRPGTNSNSAGTTKQYSTIKVSYGNTNNYDPIEGVQILFSGHKVGNSLAAVDPGTYDYVPTWVSTPTIGDTFHRTARPLDGASLVDGASVSAWTDPQAVTWQINTAYAVRPGSVGGSNTHLLAELSAADGWLEVFVATWNPSGSGGDGSGLVARAQPTGSSLVGLFMFTDGYRIRSVSGGTNTTLGTLIEKIPAANDRLRLRLLGDQLSVQVNSLPVQAVTLPANLTATLGGLRRGSGSGTTAVAFKGDFGFWDIDEDPGWGW